MDTWGVGKYEDTAAELAPVSDVAVAALQLSGSEQVLDVACGTGNAALLAHRAGAAITGLDGSPRLLAVAQDRVPDVAVVERELAHARGSAEEFWDRWERLHPMWIAARSQLEPAGEWESLREAAIAALREGGIGEGATSPYLLAVLTRG